MFFTKADTLKYLFGKVKKSHIEKLFIVTASEFETNREEIYQKIKEYFHAKKLVIRSSSSNEDSTKSSNAGHYDSVLNVDASDREEVIRAVEQVFSSYRKDIPDIAEEQVLIQTMTEHISYSGVVFSRDIKLNRPYYTITYDRTSTDAVTSGVGGSTVYISRAADVSSLDAHWHALIDAVCELEEIYPDYPLDIEFAIDGKNQVTLFQVRPLAACMNLDGPCMTDEEFAQMIEDAKKQYDAICGHFNKKDIILSDMAFWNPAEMIGVNPHPLDYSLYREIITKSAWNQGLNYIGYKEVNDELMYQLANKPYISLLNSFRCLTPDELDAPLEEKLISYYNKKLINDPAAHDKIEFEIVFSNFDFSTTEKLEALKEHGFSKDEIWDIESALFCLTNNAVMNFKRNRRKDIRALNGLRVHRENIRGAFQMAANDVNSLIRFFTELIESIKQYGTPKFARQARLAFISKALCKSLVAKGYFSSQEIDDFMMSIYTVASEYDADFQDFVDGKITRATFDEMYGHLRSGTYDITCDTYACREFDRLQGSEDAKKQRQRIEKLKHTPIDMIRLSKALDEIGFYIDAKEFVEFLRESMEEREYFKFEFTKSLSLAIDILVEIGNRLGISKNEMAYLTVEDIVMSVHLKKAEPVNAKDAGTGGYIWKNGGEENELSIQYDMAIRDKWLHIIEENKKRYNRNSNLILPDVLWNRNQLDVIELLQARPNFITSARVVGEVVVLDEEKQDGQSFVDVCDKIVVIPKADPGYDWIFAKGIKGFITKYGGVASHMAIRCAEFNIPAALGCGEVIYHFASRQKVLVLDCKNGKIQKEE